MATVKWRGDAPKVKQVQAWVFAGTWENDDLVWVKIGTKMVRVTTGSTVIATLIDTLVTALNASTYPEFAEITWSRSSSTLLGTADTDGVAFSATAYSSEANGADADAQTIDGVATSTLTASGSAGNATTANSGPNDWSVAANWSGGAVPVNSDDVIIENSSVDILYGFAQSAVTLTSLSVMASYTGKIGLPALNGTVGSTTSYFEYRSTYLAIGATTINIGLGPGQGSGRIKINTGSVQTLVNVYQTGQPAETGVESFLFIGTHASNAVNVNRGSVGIAVLSGEVATVLTLNVGYLVDVLGDAKVRCGLGVTLGTVVKAGGNLETRCAFTTGTQTGGTWTHGAGAVTTLNVDSGTLNYDSTGTCTTANVAKGTLTFARDMRSKTVTTCNLFSGATLLDPNRIVTFTNPVVLNRCSIPEVTLNLGLHIKLAVTAGP